MTIEKAKEVEAPKLDLSKLPPMPGYGAVWAYYHTNDAPDYPYRWSMTECPCVSARSAYEEAAYQFGDYRPVVSTIRVFELPEKPKN